VRATLFPCNLFSAQPSSAQPINAAESSNAVEWSR
jgi:hypothetical protein